MANLVFNIAKGRLGTYCDLAAANDALILVPIETSGLETDATLKDYTNLATLLAGTTNEQTTAGRKTITSATVTIDNTNDWVDLDIADQVYTAIAASNPIGAWLICYDPDTTTGTDTTLVPLTKHDLAWTPDGTTFTVQIATAGFARAA